MINRSPKLTGGDWTVVAGQLVFVDGADYIRQSWACRLAFFQGEYKYDINFGMPYFQQILIKGFNANIVRGAFNNMTLGTPGVSSVKSLTLNFNHAARAMSVSAEAQTDLGLLPLATTVSI